MISYELAKKMKDAGFPFDWRFLFPLEKNTGVPDMCVKYPSLSELIEASGDEFLGVERTYNVEKEQHNSWEATQKTFCCDEHGESRKYGYGSTPEEAVANLWLTLQAKK